MLYDKKWDKVKVKKAKPELDKTGEVLNKAADYIKKHGWCQHFMEVNGRVCMLGAIDSVEPPITVRMPVGDITIASDACLNATYRLSEYLNAAIADWNDEEGRTKRQVLMALRKAARTKL